MAQHSLNTAGTTVITTIPSRTLWAEVIPDGQTRFYTVKLIGRTAAYEYKQSWRQFTLFNDGTGVAILDNAFDEILPDFVDTALAGSTFQLSVTGDTADITVGQPTVPVNVNWNLFLEWDAC